MNSRNLRSSNWHALLALVASICLAGSSGLSLAHHPPGDVTALAGTRPCIDATSVQVNLTGSGNELLPLAVAIEERLRSLLQSGSGLYGLEPLREERCERGSAHLQMALSGRLLDPDVYIGYPPSSVSSDLSIRLIRRNRRGSAAMDGEVLYLVHGASLHSLRDAEVAFDAHIENLAQRGLSSFARQWWVANPPGAAREALIIRVAIVSALLFTLIASILTFRFWQRRHQPNVAKGRTLKGNVEQ